MLKVGDRREYEVDEENEWMVEYDMNLFLVQTWLVVIRVSVEIGGTGRRSLIWVPFSVNIRRHIRTRSPHRLAMTW